VWDMMERMVGDEADNAVREKGITVVCAGVIEKMAKHTFNPCTLTNVCAVGEEQLHKLNLVAVHSHTEKRKNKE